MAERRRDTERWERNLERGVVWVPYLLLAGATAFTLLLQPSQTWRYRLTIVGLAAVAAAWMLFMHTLRSQRWRRRPVPMTVYFAVMLLIAVLLMQRSFFFVAFACTGFIQAFAVLPTTLALLGLLATSVIVNTRPGEFPNGTLGSVLVWLFIIGLQTTLTGFFSFMGAKLMEEHIKRRELVAQLEAALAENAGLHEQLLVLALAGCGSGSDDSGVETVGEDGNSW